jgi:NADH-quinone oxidoreductase subunit H
MTFFSDPVNFIADWLRGLLAGWGASSDALTFIMSLLGAGVLAMGSLLWVIFLIWYERKIIGRIQDRLGPNRVGPWGIFQPFADMLKIFTKEFITPEGADRIPFNLAPVLSVASAMTIYGVNLSVAVLYVVAVGALGDLAIIMAGWSSNNKYAMLGAFRVVAQLISYEIPMVFSLMVPVLLAGSMSIIEVVKAQTPWFIVTAPLAALIFFITSVAEVGRAPFDLVEAESEIVAGFNIEYSGLKFGFFYVAEFMLAFTISMLFAVFFLGGWRGPWAENYPLLGFIYFGIKTMLVYFVVILLRGSLPRFRIDQMMDINWKLLTPLAMVVVSVTAVLAKLMENFNWALYILVMLLANAGILLVTSVLLSRFARTKRVSFDPPRIRRVERSPVPVAPVKQSDETPA